MNWTLGELVDIYRGKTILKNVESEGKKVKILNISNIREDQILYDSMEEAVLPEEEIRKHRVQTGDLVMTARGTRFKCGVLDSVTEENIILSGNLIGLRPHQPLHGKYLNIYFRSLIGMKQIDELCRTDKGINLGKKQIVDLLIPMKPEKSMMLLVERFEKEQQACISRTKQVQEQWNRIQQEIFQELEEGVPLRNQRDPFSKSEDSIVRKRESLFIELD